MNARGDPKRSGVHRNGAAPLPSFQQEEDVTTTSIDEEGNILAGIKTQLRLYGAMCAEREPSKRIKLLVDDGIKREVSFRRDQLLECESALLRIFEALPAGDRIQVTELAKVGDECRFCDIRHVCESYLREAPKAWRKNNDWRPPQDTWGHVLTVRRGSQGWDVKLKDLAGRVVKVFGIDADRAPWLGEAQVGDHLWFFGLGRDGAPRRWTAPPELP